MVTMNISMRDKDPTNQVRPVMGIIFELLENFLAMKFSGRTGFLQKAIPK